MAAARAVAKACADLRTGTVRTLQLGGDLMGDVDARALAEALYQNDSLTALGLLVSQSEVGWGSRALTSVCRTVAWARTAPGLLRRLCEGAAASRIFISS